MCCIYKNEAFSNRNHIDEINVHTLCSGRHISTSMWNSLEMHGEDFPLLFSISAISDKETTEPKGMEKNQRQHDGEEFTEHRVALNEEFEEREHQSEESESEFVPITGSPVN